MSKATADKNAHEEFTHTDADDDCEDGRPFDDSSPLIESGSSNSVCRYVYFSHFLSAWGARMWQFGAGLFLVIINPDSLLLTAVYGFVMGAAMLVLGPLVGDWVDNTPRLSAARSSLIVQNLSIAMCSVVVYFVIIYRTDIEEQWPDKSLLTLCFGVIILISTIAQLASSANTIAVEKDWIVEICGSNTDLLATTSAILKSIDLITNIVAPIVTGQIMAFASTEVGALFIGGWNVVSVFLEYYLLWKVYNVVPALRAKKEKCRVEKADIKHEVSISCTSCMKRILGTFVTLARGWKTYMKYDVAFAGLGLAFLFMTVLGFDNITVGFAYTQGVNESVMGALMAAGAVMGILGSIIYPRMRSLVGQQRTGLYGLLFQTTFLTLCVASVWAPGSPFILHYNKEEKLTLQELNKTTELSFLNMSTSGQSTSATNTTRGSTDNVWQDYISIGLLMTGIIGARCGLWMTDLTITQLFLETVAEQERGIVFGVQNSLNQLMDTLKFVMVIVAPEPEVFGLLVLISFAFVLIGCALYAKYSHSVRGHLFHAFDKLKALKRVDKNTLLSDNFVTYTKRYSDFTE
ncbi:solute carrier family 40 member 1-like isoform X2 [Ruditapes philippinarum]|uniref:solute carrier family 40 member 1-like isoform X2 n=1 Tax=Ruditapes philippinarum TaxID=129788 RepID=UPI00295AFDF5|nr:solute carrier family 40 member 1-like isoform X2 [Ruditapes philippinarum]